MSARISKIAAAAAVACAGIAAIAASRASSSNVKIGDTVKAGDFFVDRNAPAVGDGFELKEGVTSIDRSDPVLFGLMALDLAPEVGKEPVKACAAIIDHNSGNIYMLFETDDGDINITADSILYRVQ